MAHKLRILICQQFAGEAQALSLEPEFSDMLIGAYHDFCIHPQKAQFDVFPCMEEIKDQEIDTILVGVCKLSGQAFTQWLARAKHIHHLDQCFYLFAGRTQIDHYLREGAYLLTPGWLQNWERHIAQWGFEQSSARMFFQECARQLVLLDTGIDPHAATQLRAFADFIDLPASVVPVGLDHLRLLLRTLVQQWRLQATATNEFPPDSPILAEYMMAFDLLVQLTHIMDETEAIQAILTMATMLYGARYIFYVPVNDGNIGNVIMNPPASVAINAEALASILAERTYVEQPQGFYLRIANREEIVGILGVDEIPCPERIKDYLNLALAIVPLCGLAIVNARAISARNRAEEALREKSEALERSNAELEQFAFIASHDLQAPLRKIIAFGDLIQTRYAQGLEPTAQEYLLHMQHCAERMRNLIDDLLTYSRVGTQHVPFSNVSLAEVVNQVLDDLEQQITDSHGEVIVEDLPTVFADMRQMQQLFQNLIGNALKFTHPGVTPVVHVVGRLLGSGLVEITVADNGIGFDEQYLEKIYRPFQRLHTQEQYPGTGIGLAICQKIVLRHGGALTARSREGEGATFIIHLPMAPTQS